MVIGIIGENCSGKSTLAEQIRRALGGEIVTGKDYLRLAKTEGEAAARFRTQLHSALRGGHLIYVISEPAQAALLPEEAIRILVYADLDTIKARFRARMRGTLPPPVEQMLERKHGMFDAGTYDFRFDGTSGDAPALCEALRARLDEERDLIYYSAKTPLPDGKTPAATEDRR